MEFDEFRKAALRTWNTELSGPDRKSHAILTLTTEAAEVADIWKKVYFSNRPDRPRVVNEDFLMKEIGDTAYGLVVVCEEFKIDLGECLQRTTDKLNKRYGVKNEPDTENP